ncbi:hypothetical protein EPUL_004975 [Erysiphe pulchra]|uniref:Uncharacterized protein n=1 Tax=Erysiphe pulchra TaxID=225359 RepID=A0A2S4PMU0_9PEZI|nr:hypothetical protein EPUL_004975 [Erysiphe pulchra]
MAHSARENKRFVSETQDPKSRIQKSLNITGLAQLNTTTFTRFIARANVVAESFAAVQAFINSMPMMKARGLLNQVVLYVKEMKTDSPGAGAEFPAPIFEVVSPDVGGK